MSNEPCPDRDRLIELYKVAIETRNMEIGLFWQRSNYFLVLNTAIAVGFFSVKTGTYQLPLSIFGAITCILWIMITFGGKYWQTRWEYEAASMEGKLKKDMMGEDINMFSSTKEMNDINIRESILKWKKIKSLSLFDRLVLWKPSVSKIMVLLALTFLLFWFYLIAVSVCQSL